MGPDGRPLCVSGVERHDQASEVAPARELNDAHYQLQREGGEKVGRGASHAGGRGDTPPPTTRHVYGALN